jgi:hypothetical protein
MSQYSRNQSRDAYMDFRLLQWPLWSSESVIRSLREPGPLSLVPVDFEIERGTRQRCSSFSPSVFASSGGADIMPQTLCREKETPLLIALPNNGYTKSMEKKVYLIRGADALCCPPARGLPALAQGLTVSVKDPVSLRSHRE